MKQGSFIGGMLLIAGSCIGAGMLALPIVTGIAGFFPSVIMFLTAWAFMTATALLMVEVQGSFKERTNIVSMAEKTLGTAVKTVAWILYLFLFYSLSVAYISGSGSLTSTYFQTVLSWNVPRWAGALFFTAVFSWIVYQGTKRVDLWNRFFMAGKILTYVAMIFLGARYIQPHLLLYQNTAHAFFALPVLVIAFGFHNMVPTLMHYLDNDTRKVRQTILAGSLFALVVYLIWEVVVLGIVPLEGPWGLIESLKKGRQASDAVAGVLGISWVSTFAEALAFFALLSSFLAQTLALVHFLADALKVKSEKQESWALCGLALLPPLVFALIYPDLFVKALNFAGGVCAVALFGVLPALMAWKGRYVQKNLMAYQLAGGKVVLLCVIVLALSIMAFQILHMFSSHF